MDKHIWLNYDIKLLVWPNEDRLIDIIPETSILAKFLSRSTRTQPRTRGSRCEPCCLYRFVAITAETTYTQAKRPTRLGKTQNEKSTSASRSFALCSIVTIVATKSATKQTLNKATTKWSLVEKELGTENSSWITWTTKNKKGC